MTKVILPRCKFCDSVNAVKCPNCDVWTCYECMIILNDSECVHKQFEPINSWSWEFDITDKYTVP